jgi:dsDNA-specific endonuclease/ATPase MutS2
MVFMDKNTMEALDFQYVLDRIETLTPYGKMQKSRMKPYNMGVEEKLKESLGILEAYIPYVRDLNIRREFNNILGHIKDLRNSMKRAMEGFILTEVELFEIKGLLFLIRDIDNLFNKHNIIRFGDTDIIPVKSLEELLDPEGTGIGSFYIYDEYSEKLKDIREKKRQTDKDIKLSYKEIKENIKEELQLNLRPDNTVVVSKDNVDLINKLESTNLLSYVSETYLNIKFGIKPTERITHLERQLLLLKDQEEREEVLLREMLSKEIGKRRREIFINMVNIGKLDLILAKAKYAIDVSGVKPKIWDKHEIIIEEGIHPKVSDFLKSRNLKFTPISVSLKEGVSCITGANMGGKTISLKLIGLLSAMAQYGLFVPAKSMALGLNSYIKSSIGDMQSTDSGLSTFGGEIKVVEEAIKRADEKGLILIDELARGTNPVEGYAISKAIVMYLMNKKSITLLTTHYDNVADMENIQHLQVVGLSEIDFNTLKQNINPDEGMDIINKYMDYRLRPVDRSKTIPKDAINIAKLMGLNEEILRIAEELMTIDN